MAEEIAIFKSSLEDVWEIVTDFDKSAWRTDIVEVDIAEDRKSYTETDINGVKTKYTIVENTPMKKYRVEFENTKIKGYLQAEFELKDIGSQVKFSQESEMFGSLANIFGGFLINENRVLLRMIYDMKKELKEI